MAIYAIYRSELYAVTRHPEGVEIKAWSSPERPSVWLQGEEADAFEEMLDSIPEGSPYTADDAAGEYFGN